MPKARFEVDYLTYSSYLTLPDLLYPNLRYYKAKSLSGAFRSHLRE